MLNMSMMLLVGEQSLASEFPGRLFSLEASLPVRGFEDVDEGMIKGCNSSGWPLDNCVLFLNVNLRRALSPDFLLV